MRCMVCGEGIRADCMLNCDICVFCFYDTPSWDSNGQLVTREEAAGALPGMRPVKERKVRPRVALDAVTRAVLPHLLNCTIVALVRSADAGDLHLDFLSEVLSRFGFRVVRSDI